MAAFAGKARSNLGGRRVAGVSNLRQPDTIRRDSRHVPGSQEAGFA